MTARGIRPARRLASLRVGMTVALLVALTVPAVGQPDPAYVPPKGGYDTPGTFIKVLGSAGETYERTLGQPQTNAYQRQVRFKLLGLENLSRLTELKGRVDADARAEEERKAKAQDGKGGLLGGLLGRLNPMMAKEVDRQKEAARDDLVLRLIEAGSPQDTSTAALADVLLPPNQVTGSFFGARINNKVKVSVDAEDFKPRILIVRYRQKGAMTPLQSDASPEFAVVAEVDTEGMGTTKVTANYDRAAVAPEGTTGIYIVVTSEDGKATGGKYTIKYHQ